MNRREFFKAASVAPVAVPMAAAGVLESQAGWWTAGPMALGRFRRGAALLPVTFTITGVDYSFPSPLSRYDADAQNFTEGAQELVELADEVTRMPAIFTTAIERLADAAMNAVETVASLAAQKSEEPAQEISDHPVVTRPRIPAVVAVQS